MKRLLAYLFIVLGFSVISNVKTEAAVIQVCDKWGSTLPTNFFKSERKWKKHKNSSGKCKSYFKKDSKLIYNDLKNILKRYPYSDKTYTNIINKSDYSGFVNKHNVSWGNTGKDEILFAGNVMSIKAYCQLVDNHIGSLKNSIKYEKNCKKKPSKAQITKAEPAKKKKVVKKEQPKKKKKKVKKEITNVGNSKKIKKIIKIDNKEPVKENISSWEKNVLAAIDNEKNDPYCEAKDKISLKSLSSSKEKNLTKAYKKNYCIKKSDLLQLGEFKKLNLPNFILNEIKGCQTNVCIGQHAGKKVYELFVRRGPIYHARYPGKMINGMVWFEILYYEKFRKLQKILKRYEENRYEGIYKLKKANHEKQIYSLIKLNKGRIKMRKALGFTLYDDNIKVIESQWLLAEFLNKDKLTVSRVKLSPEMHKRKLLIEKYKTLLAKYKKKLEEEKAKKNKS